MALKIIKLGMDTKQVTARFEAERLSLEARQCQSLNNLARNVATPLQRADFTALMAQILLFQSVEQVAVKPGFSLQAVLAVQGHLERIRVEWLAWTHGDTFKDDNVLLAVNPRLR